MSDLYTSLRVSPRKKRALPEDDDNLLTPKRMRIAPPTPPTTVTRKSTNNRGPFGKPAATPLPSHLDRLFTIQTALQHALSHALATCGLSPSDSGIVRNVVNHIGLNTYAGFTTKLDTDDLRRLCWLWEWDSKEQSSGNAKGKGKACDEDEDNPFLEDKPVAPTTRDWSRGAMGFVLGQSSHHSKVAGSRVPAYGIGIEVEMDIDKDMGGGMAAVARWTADGETRRAEFRKKLERWIELHKDQLPIPNIPLADIPSLPTHAKSSTFTRLLASSSPKSPSSSSILATPSSPTLSTFLKSPSKSPSKRPLREFAIPFPTTPSSRATSPTKNSILFPKTPSSRHRDEDENPFLTPSHARTPATPVPDTPSSTSSSTPSTPVHQRGPGAVTAPETPTSSRRAALYDRIRQKSEAAQTPTKAKPNLGRTPKMSKEQLMKLSQQEMRRRCLLGRLSGVAESVWMLFSNPAAGSIAPTTRKRRALPSSEVIAAILKSSPVPMSSADADESLDMLISLCPFFLRKMDVGSEAWLEMPASSNSTSSDDSPSKVPSSPSKNRGKDDSAMELLMRSPKRVKYESGGLREVRERIRKELESQD